MRLGRGNENHQQHHRLDCANVRACVRMLCAKLFKHAHRGRTIAYEIIDRVAHVGAGLGGRRTHRPNALGRGKIAIH